MTIKEKILGILLETSRQVNETDSLTDIEVILAPYNLMYFNLLLFDAKIIINFECGMWNAE